MLNKYITISLIAFISLELSAQNYDNQWLYGRFDGIEFNNGLTLLDFNDNIVTWNHIPNVESKFYLGFTGSFINDEAGQLSYFTNGCTIKNKDSEIISGDEYITTTGDGVPGCNSEVLQDYPAYQSNILLPNLTDDTRSYIIHNDFHVSSFYGRAENMYFSTITELGDSVVFEKKGAINPEYLMCLRLTAVPSADLLAWWIVLPRTESNVFDIFKVENDTAYLVNTQEIGIVLKCNELDTGQAQFSNDGKTLGINSEVDGALLYDFDNETGVLSNFRSIPYDNSIELAQGLCFSMDNTKLYVNSAQYLYQIDLADNNKTTFLAEVFEPDETGWPISLGMMFMGPDCRIYISPGSTTHYIHTIESPNKAGEACDFRKNRINSPTKVAHHFPNIPQYRYINGCDSTIVLPEIVPIIEQVFEPKIVIYPNPSSDVITISGNENMSGKLQIFNAVGKLIHTEHSIENKITIDINHLPAGLYTLKIEGNNTIMKFIKI